MPRRKDRWPDGPRGHWFFGNGPDYDADRIGFLLRCHRAYGDVFSFDERTVFVIEPALARAALARTNRGFLAGLAPFEDVSGLDRATARAGSWMSARPDIWRGLNRAASPGLDQRTVRILDEVVDGTDAAVVDVLAVTRAFTSAAVADHCFGADGAAVPRMLAEHLAATHPFEVASYQFPAWLPLPRNRRFHRVHRRLSGTLANIVRDRRLTRRSVPSGGDLLDLLLTADPAASDRRVTATLRAVLIGGHGVPAAALASIVWELARRPELVARLRVEAEGSARGGAPPAAHLPLAEAVVKEVLRLHPPVWLMTRVAPEDTSLGPWRLRRGDEVLVNAYLIHRDPRWWPRPDEFDPARWAAHRPGPAYLPFGAGPQVCLGAVLAMRQLTLATSRLAQRFTIDAPNAGSAAPAFLGRLAPEGLLTRFVAR